MAKKLDSKTRRKAWILLVLVLMMMCIPARIALKDGGTVEYRAILYTVTKRHGADVQNHRMGYHTGTQVRVLFWEIYDDVEFVPNDIEAQLSPAE